jgi:hypothetical protein
MEMFLQSVVQLLSKETIQKVLYNSTAQEVNI